MLPKMATSWDWRWLRSVVVLFRILGPQEMKFWLIYLSFLILSSFVFGLAPCANVSQTCGYGGLDPHCDWETCCDNVTLKCTRRRDLGNFCSQSDSSGGSDNSGFNMYLMSCANQTCNESDVVIAGEACAASDHTRIHGGCKRGQKKS